MPRPLVPMLMAMMAIPFLLSLLIIVIFFQNALSYGEQELAWLLLGSWVVFVGLFLVTVIKKWHLS